MRGQGGFELETMGAAVEALGTAAFGPRLFEYLASALGAEYVEAMLWRAVNEARLVVAAGRAPAGIAAPASDLAHALADLPVGMRALTDLEGHPAADGPLCTLWRTVASGALRVRITFAAPPRGAVDLRRRRWRDFGEIALSLLAKHLALAERQAAALEPRTPERGDLVALHQHSAADSPPARLAPPSLEVPSGSRVELLAHLREVLLAEPCSLSPREAEVCAGIILGYTTLGISLNFGISLNTVATHRKRAYRKLGISSQNELFSCYFKTVHHKIAANAFWSGAGDQRRTVLRGGSAAAG